MSFTFSATGLPPGLSIVGSQILGTPSTPGNYTVTFTVTDGVSSVSNVVSITIAPAAVPIPFWKLILSADCGSYSLDSARSQLQAFADAGSYWRDNVAIATLLAADSGSYWLDSVEAAPLFVAEAGSYWLDSFEAAIAETGSYWLDSVGTEATLQAEAGSYWLDSVEAAIAETGSYWLDSVESAATLQAETTSWISRVQGLGGTPTTTGQAAVDAFFVAIKPQSYYSKLKLMQLLAGATTIASAMAPLLHPTNTAATPTGFTGSNYTASGAGAGIQGNSSGYINHNFSLFDNLPGSSAAIGAYSKTDGAFSDVYDVGHLVNSSAAFVISMKWGDGNFYADCFEATANGRVFGVSPGAVGLGLLNRTSTTDLQYFFAGTQHGINTNTAPAMPTDLNALFSFAGRANFGASPRKLLFICATTGMTPTEVSHFTSQVNTLAGTV